MTKQMLARLIYRLQEYCTYGYWDNFVEIPCYKCKEKCGLFVDMYNNKRLECESND